MSQGSLLSQIQEAKVVHGFYIIFNSSRNVFLVGVSQNKDLKLSGIGTREPKTCFTFVHSKQLRS